MRLTTKILTTAAALVFATATVAPATTYQSASVMPSVTAVAITPATPAIHMATAVLTQDAKLEVKVSDNRGGAWYTQPMWIAIGVIALVVIILLAVVAGRRDSTTVVK
jgi:hypothetical protein